MKVWRILYSKCLESMSTHDNAVNSVVVGFDELVSPDPRWYNQSVKAGDQREEWGYEARASYGSVVAGDHGDSIGGFAHGRCRVLWTRPIILCPSIFKILAPPLREWLSGSCYLGVCGPDPLFLFCFRFMC